MYVGTLIDLLYFHFFTFLLFICLFHFHFFTYDLQIEAGNSTAVCGNSDRSFPDHSLFNGGRRPCHHCALYCTLATIVPCTVPLYCTLPPVRFLVFVLFLLLHPLAADFRSQIIISNMLPPFSYSCVWLCLNLRSILVSVFDFLGTYF